MAPLISKNTSPTQNHAMISRRTFCCVVSCSSTGFSFRVCALSVFTIHQQCLHPLYRRDAESEKRGTAVESFKTCERAGANGFHADGGGHLRRRTGARDLGGSPRPARARPRHVDQDRSADDV